MFKKSNVDETMFINNITPESAYLLGFIWADGYLSTVKFQFTIGVEISKYDMDDISCLFDKTGLWLNYIRTRKNSTNIMHRKYASNKELWTFLNNNDYKSKSSSPSKIINKIPKELQHYWWRGYFDGDGTIGKYVRSRKIGFTSCYDQDWSFFYDLCVNLNIEKYGYVQGGCKKGRHSKVHIQNKDGINKMFNYIYPNGYDFGFKRKYDKIIYTLS